MDSQTEIGLGQSSYRREAGLLHELILRIMAWLASADPRERLVRARRMQGHPGRSSPDRKRASAKTMPVSNRQKGNVK